MSEVKHLKYFKVENFKCFETFEMNDIGQFNLIVGDNNVGKSTVLEALLFDENIESTANRFKHAFIERLHLSNVQSPKINFIDVNKNIKFKNNAINFELSYRTQLNSSKYKLYTRNVPQLSQDEIALLQKKNLTIDQNKTVILLENNESMKQVKYLEDSWTQLGYSPLVFYNLGYAEDLIGYYSSQVQISKEKKEEFISDLSVFIEGIEDIELSQNIIPNQTNISIRIKDIDSIILLSMYGEGTNKLFRILLEQQVTRNNYLLVDEIDTGIHFSRFKKYWKTILKSALKNNVQLFSTTHSLECLKYFKEALEELGEDFKSKSRLFHLAKTKDGRIKAYNYNYSQFSSNIELENEMRG